VCIPSFVRLFVRSFSFVRSFARSFVRSRRLFIFFLQFDGLFFLNRFVDVCFMTDLGLNFTTGYFDFDVGLWITDRGKIARAYGHSWFPIDAVSVFPFDVFSLASGSEEAGNLAVLRLVRLARLLKASTHPAARPTTTRQPPPRPTTDVAKPDGTRERARDGGRDHRRRRVEDAREIDDGRGGAARRHRQRTIGSADAARGRAGMPTARAERVPEEEDHEMRVATLRPRGELLFADNPRPRIESHTSSPLRRRTARPRCVIVAKRECLSGSRGGRSDKTGALRCRPRAAAAGRTAA
jgi:hypothetical protein